MTWHWPQIVVGIYLLMEFGSGVIRTTKTGTTSERFAGLLVCVSITALIVYALGVVGFWTPFP